MGAVYNYINAGNNTIKVRPRLVSNNITKNFDEFEVSLPTITTINYGALYNWYAATDSRKISSSDDWVVPSKTQWENLFNSLDTYDSDITGWPVLGTKLRESGWDHWYQTLEEADGIEGTDDYGLSLVGDGDRGYDDGLFLGLKQSLQIWSSTDLGGGLAYAIYTAFSINEITDSNGNYASGYSVRLCNPSTLFSEGEVGAYTQNNGDILNTIVINGIEWLSQNLGETKYRNGDWISGYDGGVYTPISNANWAAKTTEAMCYYNDEINNG